MYTKEQCEIIQLELNNGKSVKEIASSLSLKFNRPITGITSKIFEVKRLAKKGETPSEKRTFRSPMFYSKEQIMTIERELLNGLSPVEIGHKYNKPWNRNRIALEQRCRVAKSKLIASGEFDTSQPRRTTILQNTMEAEEQKSPKIKHEEHIEIKQEGVVIPKGFVFTGTPKKVTLMSDHFRVYF